MAAWVIDYYGHFCSRCDEFFLADPSRNYKYCHSCRRQSARLTYAKHREHYLSESKSYYWSNRDKALRYHRERRAANLDAINATARQHYSKRRATSLVSLARIRLNAARQRAKANNYSFELTLDWVLSRFNVGTCEATGLSFNFFDKPPIGARMHPFAPSIDRVNSSDGYTLVNSRVVIWLVNRMKGDIDPTLFADIVRRLGNDHSE